MSARGLYRGFESASQAPLKTWAVATNGARGSWSWQQRFRRCRAASGLRGRSREAGARALRTRPTAVGKIYRGRQVGLARPALATVQNVACLGLRDQEIRVFLQQETPGERIAAAALTAATYPA